MEMNISMKGLLTIAMMLLLGASYLNGNTNHLLFTGFAFIAVIILMSVSWIIEKLDELIEVAKEN